MRSHWLCLAVLAATIAVAPIAEAQRRLPPPSKEAAMFSFAPVAKKAAPAVVNVYARGRVQTPPTRMAEEQFFRRFFGERFGMPQESCKIRSARASSCIRTGLSSPTRTW